MPTYQGFRGINNRDPETRLAVDELREALNIDLDNTGLVRRRQGYTVVNAGEAHSLWGHGDLCLFVRGSELRRLNEDDTDTLMASGLTLDAPASFVEINGEVYWSNGHQKGVIRNGVNYPWGLPIPSSPTLSLLPGGGLPAGKYQACATLVDTDGREGPAGKVAQITLASPHMIQLTFTSKLSEPRIKHANLYLTPANGDRFYFAGSVTGYLPNLFVTGDHYTTPLRTQHLASPPPGHLVRYYRGRVWIAQENVLWFTDALGYHLNDPSRGFFQFPQAIDLLEPVTDGFFIGADKTYFLAGTHPDEMALREIASYGAVRGTSVTVDGSLVRVGDQSLNGLVALWTSPKGICAGASSGVFINLTESRLAMNAEGIGAALFREKDGLRQYLSLLNGGREGSAFKAQDRFDAEVIRNGSLIPP